MKTTLELLEGVEKTRELLRLAYNNLPISDDEMLEAGHVIMWAREELTRRLREELDL